MVTGQRPFKAPTKRLTFLSKKNALQGLWKKYNDARAKIDEKREYNFSQESKMIAHRAISNTSVSVRLRGLESVSSTGRRGSMNVVVLEL